MKNRFFAIFFVIIFVLTFDGSAMAEKWGSDDFGLSLAYYTCDENGELSTGTTGSYTLGDYFYFEYDLWIHSAEGKRAVYKVNLMVDNGVNAVEITDFQYFNGSTWTDASAFRGTRNDTGPLRTLTNNMQTRFRVRFHKNTTYMIEASCVGENNEFGITSARYIVLNNGTYTVYRQGNVEELTTTDETTEEPTTEEPTTEEPTTELTTAESATEQPTTTESEVTEPVSTEPETEESGTEEPVPDEDFKIASKTLLLSSGITLAFKVNGNLFSDNYTNPKVVVALDGIETEITEYTADSTGKYRFDFTKITPDKMNVMVTATLHAYKNGVEYISPEIEYSVSTYCYNMLDKYGETTGYETFRTLLVDLLNYGAASQNYTGFNINNPANNNLTSKQQGWASGDITEMTNVKDNKYQTIDNPRVIWKTSSLALQNAVVVRMKFQAESLNGLVVRVRDDYGMTWYIEPKDFEPAVGTENQYYVNFNEFTVARMSDNIYFTVYEGSTPVSNTYRYSVESYAYAHQNDGNALGALVVAMMKYGNSARAYV